MLATVAVITYHSTGSLEDTAEWDSRSHEFLNELSAFELHVMEADSAARGYLLGADDQYIPAYANAREQLVQDMQTIQESVAHNQSEQEGTRATEMSLVESLRTLLSKKTAILKAAIAARQEHGLDTAAQMIGDGQDEEITKSIRGILDQLQSGEKSRLKDRSNLSAAIGRSSIAVVLMATVLSAVILTLATLLILRDIAVRRRAEEALAEEHNLLRSVMDAMPEQVFVTDRDGRFIIDNISHRRFVGAKGSSEVEGKTAGDFFPPTIAQDMIKDNTVIMESGLPVLN